MSDQRAHMNRDLEVSAGDDFVIQTTVYDEAGQVVNISAFTTAFGIYRKSDGRQVISKADGAGVSVTDGNNGIIQAVVDAADTVDLAGEYIHETDVIDLATKRATVSSGTLTIHPKRT